MDNKDKYFKYQWQYKKEDLKYCPRCGAPISLEIIHIPDRPQLICHHCEFIFYLDPKLVVAALVTCGGKVLLLKRAEDPGKGLWAFPGGYIERGDDPYETIKREVMEETGIEIKIKEILKTYSYPELGMLQLVFEAETKSADKTVVTNIENFIGGFFSWDEIPWDKLAFESTRDTLKNYIRMHKITLTNK
jgi:8-oxo-dGTP pyrophosphatase MutT (NUDIX family)